MRIFARARPPARGTMSRMAVIREITMDDWELMRDVRLAALADAPSAFASSYAREAAFTRVHWQRRINERSVTFLAYDTADGAADGTVPAGLAGVYIEDLTPDVVSMWVRPRFRGRGVGEALLEATAAWAKSRSHPVLYLWVIETNTPARRLYERCGFTPTGESMPLPSDPSLPEIRMSRPL